MTQWQNLLDVVGFERAKLFSTVRFSIAVDHCP
jgi:hypothetical protein